MKFNNLLIMVLFLCCIFVGGLLGGVIYFQMNTVQTVLETIDIQIPLAQNSTSGAVNITTLQDIFGITVYPLLGLKDSLPYLVYFMIFAFIIGLAISGYMSSKNPIFFALHILFTILLTYFSLILSNTYQTLLTDTFINSLMTKFSIYNLTMIYLPQIFFVTSLIFGAIAFIMITKPSTKNHPYGVNYGDEF